MLLSPGQSPRHLSFSPSESPSSKALTVLNSPNSAPPSQNPRTRQSVVDEDSYVAAIEKIIERDYFPDIKSLRDRHELLLAYRSGDPMQIKDAELKMMERRTGKKQRRGTDRLSRTPGTASLNFDSVSGTPFEFDRTPLSVSGNGGVDCENCENSVDENIEKLSLDGFFRRYTSEDNDSFSKILDKENRRKKERFGYLREGERGDLGVESLELEKRDRITDGYGTSGQPTSTLEGWKYTAKNLLMYNPVDRGEVPLTEEERAERIKGLTKEITSSNTRFHGIPNEDERPKGEDNAFAFLYTPVAGATPAVFPFLDREAEKTKKYDLEDMRRTPNPYYVESEKKGVNGYSFVKTPSPAPGVDESPFMTWGEIEGTPLRLEPVDTPVGIGGSADGPHFSIPCPPSRDVKAHSLSREAARKLRARSQMFKKPPLPSPARGRSSSPSFRMLSPAAQKFVRNAIAKSSHSVDETLRASYRGASPSTGTPKSERGLSRLGRDASLASRSPSVGDGSNPPW
ncbi:hypothetical protein Sjap_025068 [Stephania japonica]|uniref:Protein DGCR14 n=1 Tax=Stephania japonica TaxID=461633 RepID=A0AAP0HH64_9MAGN